MIKLIPTPVGKACALLPDDLSEGRYSIYEHGRYLSFPDDSFESLALEEWRRAARAMQNSLLTLDLLSTSADGQLCLDLALWLPVLLMPTSGRAVLRCQNYYALVRLPGEYGIKVESCSVLFGPQKLALDHIRRFRLPPEFLAFLLRHNPELQDGVSYLLNEGAFTSADLSLVTGGRRDSVPDTDGEGPVPPNTWRKNGTPIADRMTPTAWRLVKYLWSCEGRSSEYNSALAEALFQDHAKPVDRERIGSHSKQANRFFGDNKCDWHVTARKNYVQLLRTFF